MAARLNSKIKMKAAALVADGELSIAAIAKQLGISEKTIDNWLKQPGFRGVIEEILAAAEQRVCSIGIARKAKRVEAMNDRWRRMRQLIEERAADPKMAEVPGGRTGLLVREVKSVGAGENNTLVDEYSLDAALLREMRELERQAAQELGQWNPGGAEEAAIAAAAAMAANGPPTKVVFEWVQVKPDVGVPQNTLKTE